MIIIGQSPSDVDSVYGDSYYCIWVDETFINRLKEMQKLCLERPDLRSVSRSSRNVDFSSRDSSNDKSQLLEPAWWPYMAEDGDRRECPNQDGPELHVTREDFWFSADPGDDSAGWRTNGFELKELFKRWEKHKGRLRSTTHE